jgi:RHS repeat-associated protein
MTTIDGTWAYEYDAVGRLTRSVFTASDSAIADQDRRYEYDAAGNRVKTVINDVTTEYETNNMNQHTKVGSDTYTYDDDGNMISETGSETWSYTYDDSNNLIEAGNGTDTLSFVYDGLGNCLRTIENGVATDYVLDPVGMANVVAEYDNTGELVSWYDHGFGLVSRTYSGGDVSYYTFDAIGSTSELTDNAGDVLNAYAYDPFGGLLKQSGDSPNPYQFLGELGVAESAEGLLHMRSRFYKPELGQFLSEDPLSSVYKHERVYAGSDPINAIDPAGLRPASYTGKARDYLQKKWQYLKSSRAGEYVREGYRWAYLWLLWAKVELKFLPYNLRHRWTQLKEIDRFEVAQERIAVEILSLYESVVIWAIEFPGNLYRGNYEYVAWVWNALPPTRWLSNEFCYRFPKICEKLKGFHTWLTTPADPNQKIGPGQGEAGHVRVDAFHAYRIDFENDPDATAPAQVVFVTDQLSSNLDWSTFELTEVGFGDHIIPVPSNTQQFEYTEPMMYNDKEFEVQMDIAIDLKNGMLKAIFSSIDPETGLPPSVDIGFLPPEDDTGRGQGYVAYIIKSNSNLPTGTETRNIADITFDFGETIATNQVDPHDPGQGTDPNKEALTTIDAEGPSSSVETLPSNSGPYFEVSWSGDDANGSGIQGYTIYVQDDGGDFKPWLTNTDQTSAMFTGSLGHTYGFYSVARDYVGHEEGDKTSPEATTQISETLTEGDIDGNGVTDLGDAIMALQVECDMDSSGVYPDYMSSDADVMSDGKITTEEVIYILQVVSELRAP